MEEGERGLSLCCLPLRPHAGCSNDSFFIGLLVHSQY